MVILDLVSFSEDNWSREPIWFEANGFDFFLCLDDIIEKAMSDPKFAKIYPVITNLKLLEELIRFIQSPPRKIKGVGIANGEIFRKENGRQVSGSHRYLGVLEEDGTYNLYKKFKGGPSDGKIFFSLPILIYQSVFICFCLNSTGQIWLILRAQDESCQTTKFILEYAKTIGNMPRIRDVEDYFSRNKILICRDRIQIILNHCHDSIIIASKKTNLDYDVSKLSFSIPQQENRNPSSDVAIGVAKAQQEKESESSTDIVLLK